MVFNNPYDLGFGNGFLNMTPKSQFTTEKKTKNTHRLHQKFKFVYQKNIRKVKRQSTELEKILVNHISDKSLASRIYKELII